MNAIGPYRKLLNEIPRLESWRPRMPLVLLRVWRSKKVRAATLPWGFSLSLNIGVQATIFSMLGRFVEPTPFPWWLCGVLAVGGAACLWLAKHLWCFD